MIAIEIFNSIADGEDGTIDTLCSDLPKRGYFVGGFGSPLVFDSTEEANRSAALTAIHDYVRNTPARYVGWWTDSGTGKVYVDGSTWHTEYAEAEQVCRERGEIAFWSIADQREFRPVREG